MEKKCKKAKWLSEEALQIAVKRRKVKGKGEKERYKHLNAEFQRIARRDKKAFLSNQCEEIEENNRMGKTRPANLENSAVATGLEKVSFHSNTKERQCKECSNYHTIALTSHASKVMIKILQARLQQHVNYELPDVHAGFRKVRGTINETANVYWIIEKA